MAALALVLAFDASASVTFEEFGLMAEGCAAALRDDAIAAGLAGNGTSPDSRAAVLVWSGPSAQEVVVDWRPLPDRAAVRGFADAVRDMPRLVRAGTTAVGAALLACERLITVLPGGPSRRVIDMVGDGRSNDGPAPGPVRDRLVADGVTINGLCVLHDEPDLPANYMREVIGGPGAFVLSCLTYDDFADAMLRKLAREVA